MSDRAPTRVAIAVGVMFLVLGGCGDDAGDAGTGDQVVFGEGQPPPAFPSDFPIPASAVIGTTLIDRVNHRSEMAMQIDAVLVSAVQNFTVGFVSEGFIVDSSEGTAQTWTLAFSRGELRGQVVFQAVGEFTQAVASVNGT